MELLKLNDEICGMRPCARQATVHVIHHLTKKAEEFGKKHGPEDRKVTYQKRAEKLKQEALIDKVLVPDEIIKFSLQFDSSLRDKVLNDMSIPLSAKAFARIAAHPSMVKAVNEFREKYPNWNKWLGKSLEKLGTGSRFGTKMKNGRVKAHLQQRQRVEEAIDTIRRAQMSWLHNSGKNKIKVHLKEGEKSIKEGGEIKTDIKAEEDNEADGSDSSAAENNKSITKHQNNAEENSESDCTDSESEESSVAPPVQIVSKLNKDSKKSETVYEDNLKDRSQLLKTVVYEEVDEKESECEEEIQEARDKKKQKIAAEKKKLRSKIITQVEKEDNDSTGSESVHDSNSEKSDDSNSKNSDDNSSKKSDDDESENSAGNEFAESADECNSLHESEDDSKIDEKIAKKLLKKEKRKQKKIIPRNREVEICKFSDLLKKEETRRNDGGDDSSDSVDGDKSSRSPEKGVDPFFMTRNNEFLRIATAKREAKPEEPVRKGPKWGIEGSENWTGTRQERRARARRMMGIPDPEGISRRRGPPKLNPPSFPKQREHTRESVSLPPVKHVSPDRPEDLHPSWAAKRKMNIASVGFQGKKVKFDDSD